MWKCNYTHKSTFCKVYKLKQAWNRKKLHKNNQGSNDNVCVELRLSREQEINYNTQERILTCLFMKKYHGGKYMTTFLT